MKKLLLPVLLLTTGCDVDYDLGDSAAKSRVAVNALLTPQEDFTVKLHWSGTYSENKTEFRPVADAHIRLLENGQEVIGCSASADGETKTSFRAAAGCNYRLEISVADYGELSASTTVPEAPAARIAETEEKGHYRHFELSELIVPAAAKSIWIRGTTTSEWQWEETTERETSEILEYYTVSPFVDPVNKVNDTYHAADKGASVDFEQFLRIPHKNCEAVLPLRFSVWGSNTGGTQYHHTFRVIAASAAYDRYMRSRYKQTLNSEFNAEQNPFIEQVTVYSNIENGVGIFAGYNYCRTPQL